PRTGVRSLRGCAAVGIRAFRPGKIRVRSISHQGDAGVRVPAALVCLGDGNHAPLADQLLAHTFAASRSRFRNLVGAHAIQNVDLIFAGHLQSFGGDFERHYGAAVRTAQRKLVAVDFIPPRTTVDLSRTVGVEARVSGGIAPASNDTSN